MKKIIFTALLMIFSAGLCYSQKSIVNKFIIPRQHSFTLLKEIKKNTVDFAFNDLKVAAEPENKFHRFIYGLPSIKIKETAGRKPFSFFTQLSFSDIVENGFGKLHSGIANTYDDELPELFKDAPYAVKLHLIISL